MPETLANGPKDGDYASLIRELEEQSLKELQRGGAKPMHEGRQILPAAQPKAHAGIFKKPAVRPAGFGTGAGLQRTAAQDFKNGARTAGKSGMNIIVYLGITLALALILVISRDPEFGIFCAAAFIIVSIAFFSSRKASARRSGQSGSRMQR
ncbi:MAG: hypothetical protein ACI4NA_01045 [Succinivibrio sp.]